MSRYLFSASLALVCPFVTDCTSTTLAVGDPAAKTTVRGSAAGATYSNAGQLGRCAAPLGSIALIEDASQPWLRTLSSDYRIESTVPLLQLMVQQSNCFVVERGKGMHAMQTER